MQIQSIKPATDSADIFAYAVDKVPFRFKYIVLIVSSMCLPVLMTGYANDEHKLQRFLCQTLYLERVRLTF